MTVLVIDVDGSMRRVTLPESADAQYQMLWGIVGGNIEIVYPPVAGVHAYINEEGKFDGLARNEVATRLMAGGLLPGDFIAGPMIVLATGADGAEAPLTNEHYVDLIALIEPTEAIPAVWRSGPDFAEVAEVIGVPTDAVIGWAHDVFPAIRPGLHAVVWSEGSDVWACALERDADGILRRLDGTLQKQGTLDHLIARIEDQLDDE